MGQKVKISDVVIRALVDRGIDTVFGVTGGAVVHLFDSIEKIDGIKSVFFNHEQAASFAVESYAKAKKSLGAGIFTTGPGGTNALTGLAAAWLDSVPCLFLSGQARSNQTVRGRQLRQVGTQELDVVSMVKSVTKYAVTVYEASEVKYHIQKALYLSMQGRPGPVWVDIPVDVQWTYLDSDKLIEFLPETELPPLGARAGASTEHIARVGELLKASKRPVILAGFGVRLSGSEDDLRKFVEKYHLPFVTSWNMVDWLPSDHPLNLGRPGLSGQRGANLALQNSDLIISIGSHLNSTISGTRPELFARDARIVMVDIDANELEHCPISLEVAINADASEFLGKFELYLGGLDIKQPSSDWIEYCQKYRALNHIGLDYKDNCDRVNSYFFKSTLSSRSRPDDLFVVDGGGTVVYSALQSIEINARQRLFLSAGLCSMGSGIPEAIGVHYALPDRRIFCMVGDGSFPFNMQDLQLIRNLGLPIKIVVFNNEGYVSIRTTQKDFLEGKEVGSSPGSGLHLPSAKKIAAAFDLPYFLIEDQNDLGSRIDAIFNQPGPCICEVLISAKQEIVPRQGFAKRNDGAFEPRPLEDMYPFLDREQLRSLMIVPDVTVANTLPAGREIDLMKSYPHAKRPIEERAKDKKSRIGYVGLDEYGMSANDLLFEQMVLEKSRAFGESYFDGDRHHGYGGYKYDKRYWQGVAKDLIATYDLKPGDRILEVGCAKGFLLHDIQELVPGINVSGVDISEYAVSRAMPTVKEKVQVGDAKALPFDDRSFDLVLAINTLSELPYNECLSALNEIMRVSKGRSFITLNAWRNVREKDALFKWNISALSNHSVNEWREILKNARYAGDYYWFIAD